MAQPAESFDAPTFPKVGSIWQPLPKGKHGKQVAAHTVQTINATPDQVYNLYTRVESLPIWQEGVVSVERIGPKRLHWKMQDPGTGTPFEFDSEELEAVQGKRHVSRVLTGPTAGTTETLQLEPHPAGRGTIATLTEEYTVPGGLATRIVSSVISRSPTQVLIEDLRHLKALLEAGEIPTVEGQTAGKRGLSGKFKRYLYGENMPTPPGTRTDARPEDLPATASPNPPRWAVILGTTAAVAVLGFLFYIETRED